MSLMAVYDENVEVVIVRDGEKLYVPFCGLVEGDVVDDIKNDMFFTVGEDAHLSGDSSYPGWLVRSDSGDDWYPEDFGAKLVDFGVDKLDEDGVMPLLREMVVNKIEEFGHGELDMDLDKTDELIASDVFVGKLVELVVEEMKESGGYASDAVEYVFNRYFENWLEAYEEDNRARKNSGKVVDYSGEKYDGAHIETNMGLIPVRDYLDIVARQNGFESYEELRREGLYVDIDDEELVFMDEKGDKGMCSDVGGLVEEAAEKCEGLNELAAGQSEKIFE